MLRKYPRLEWLTPEEKDTPEDGKDEREENWLSYIILDFGMTLVWLLYLVIFHVMYPLWSVSNYVVIFKPFSSHVYMICSLKIKAKTISWLQLDYIWLQCDGFNFHQLPLDFLRTDCDLYWPGLTWSDLLFYRVWVTIAIGVIASIFSVFSRLYHRAARRDYSPSSIFLQWSIYSRPCIIWSNIQFCK